MRHLKSSGTERQLQQEHVAYLKTALLAAGLPVGTDTASHIVPLMINDAHLCRRTSELLLEEHGIYVQPINYPTVPVGQERLRITPTPFHTPAHADRLVAALTAVRNQINGGPQMKLAA